MFLCSFLPLVAAIQSNGSAIGNIGLLPLVSKAGYKESRAKLHKKTRAANTAALVVYFSFFFPLGPRGLDSGRIFQPFAK